MARTSGEVKRRAVNNGEADSGAGSGHLHPFGISLKALDEGWSGLLTVRFQQEGGDTLQLGSREADLMVGL